MAAEKTQEYHQEIQENPSLNQEKKDIFSSYLGLSFAVFLGSLPKSSLSLIPSLQSRNKSLLLKLHQAEAELKEVYSRRKEDSKANARVVEIFASHRHAWQQEEKRLLHEIDVNAEEIAHLRAKLEEFEKSEVGFKSNMEDLKREIYERDEMLNFMSKRSSEMQDYEVDLGSRFGKLRVSDGVDSLEECFVDNRGGLHNLDELTGGYVQSGNDFDSNFSNLSSKFWAERATPWQDLQYESPESVYHLKHFVARRESPWKMEGESTGISAKLKLLEQELLNLERVGKNDLSKVPSLMRKQAKRYQTLAGKIDDLCRRMASDQCEADLSPEFRTRRQTEFLLEAFRLQQRGSETGQKLLALQTETGKSCFGDALESQAQLATSRSIGSIKNNFREIQRNLEIWLARIIGDVEGSLARDGASRLKEYNASRYPFGQ
ncbi:uncharacterized protein LOC108205759 [Daucus carota subsp. sativus]|uniref:uncharacterized protein LOC108205759 n=1 Tax=Daucus carota subsp. sativus TaxID=79200 RepID=UPI0007B2825E|nr:PREDICTED: uncharacterized protein LOC108205759 [Daucus carota subsp. sativus]